MIECKRLSINLGTNQQGQVLQQAQVKTEGKRVFVEPGKYCRVEVTKDGKLIVGEFPLGAYGWEYEVL